MNVLCCVHSGLLCGFTKYTVAGTAPGLTFTMGMLAIDPGDSQAFFHQPASAVTESGPRTAAVMRLDLLWELWRQLRLYPAHPLCVRADKAHSC